MLLKCYTQYASKFGKLRNGHRIGKGQFSFQSQRRAMPKNVTTTVLLCLYHTLARLMLKILQARLPQYVNWEFPHVQAGFRKGRRTRDQITNICWITEEAREFQKNVYFCFFDYAKAFECLDCNKLWKILQEMGIPDHLTCLLRNLYTGKEATVRTRHGKMDWFQIRKGLCQGCILSPCLFNLYADYIMWNVRLIKHKLESRLPGEISITSDTQMTPSYGREQRGIKESLDESKRGESKSWLNTQHSKN